MNPSYPVFLIAFLEELAANAWPAEVVQVVDGWRLRFNDQVTRRANSVMPIGNSESSLKLEEKLTIVEDFYERRNSLVRYQICPAAQPAYLDETLAARGYQVQARTAVQTIPLEKLLARNFAKSMFPVSLSETFAHDWFNLYCRGEHIDPGTAQVRAAILRRIGPQVCFATLQIAGQPAAVGMGVIERGWLGLFNLVTASRFRRQGAATTVMAALARWGQSHRASQIYLQVMANNEPALALYNRLGFETLYYYHYRERITNTPDQTSPSSL